MNQSLTHDGSTPDVMACAGGVRNGSQVRWSLGESLTSVGFINLTRLDLNVRDLAQYLLSHSGSPEIIERHAHVGFNNFAD